MPNNRVSTQMKDTTKSICGCIMCEFHVSAAEIRDRDLGGKHAELTAPQKETRQISEEVAAWRALYPSAEFASVPAAVQGKEPQTPKDVAWKALANMNHALHCLRLEVAESIVQDLSAKITTCINVAKTLGESVGRRSAITERTDLLDALKLMIRAVGGLDGTSGSLHLAVLNGEKVVAKCAELQEKTK